jgi:hypothetical protein
MREKRLDGQGFGEMEIEALREASLPLDSHELLPEATPPRVGYRLTNAVSQTASPVQRAIAGAGDTKRVSARHRLMSRGMQAWG